MHNPIDLTGWTLVFDLDGALVDSAPDLVGALNTLLDEEGLALVPYSEVRLYVGRGARWLIERGFERAGALLDPGELDNLLQRFIAIYLGRIAHETRPFDGCLGALDALTARGATLAVCTNKLTNLSLALLDALDMTRRFAVVIGPDQAPAPKPDPRHLLTTIARAGGDPARAIHLGDTAYDTLAAQAAGIPVIAVDFGYAPDGVADLGADAVISHFDELVATVDRLASCPRPTGSL
ncbi:HAD hydrolase-like protein [Caulobacter sp. SLTY]|uniref:HAD hydrolase-like protein n=1 Tax=Caulobacter sp. SLTY TaxID=2683262 RepID=UPI001412B18C|nr:HAD hydrolase-like protein [Caulobacter sp. SLTY]NBB15572.1 HAD hydrolase-like protein [Caulobacter sp. SLTY]